MTSKYQRDQARRRENSEPEPNIILKTSDDPETSVPELMERVHKGEAFIIGGTSISKKESEFLLEQAYYRMLPKSKEIPPKIHFVSGTFYEMEIIEWRE